MPIYEFVCDDCGISVELLRKIADRDHPVMCQHPDGRQVAMRHKLSMPSVQFRGAGVTRGSSAFGRAAPAESHDVGGGPADTSKTP